MSTAPARKPLAIISGEIKSPPFSPEGRIEAGKLLRELQEGVLLGMPHSRPMPSIGPRCHELRIRDETVNWRIFYRIDQAALVVAGIFEKKTEKTLRQVISLWRKRLKDYDS